MVWFFYRYLFVHLFVHLCVSLFVLKLFVFGSVLVLPLRWGNYVCDCLFQTRWDFTNVDQRKHWSGLFWPMAFISTGTCSRCSTRDRRTWGLGTWLIHPSAWALKEKLAILLTPGDLAYTSRSARIKVLVILTQLILHVGAGTILSLQFV